MWAKGWAFLIWAAASASAVFWGLRVWGESPRAPAHAQPAPLASVASGDVARVLGAEPVTLPAAVVAAPAADTSRFQLLGVIAGAGGGSSVGSGGAGGVSAAARSSGPAWATISVDGKPARTFRVGSVVEGSHVLQKVAARGVEIGPRGGAPALTLQLAPLPPAAVGRPAGAQAPGGLSSPGGVGPAIPPALPGASLGASPGVAVGAGAPGTSGLPATEAPGPVSGVVAEGGSAEPAPSSRRRPPAANR